MRRSRNSSHGCGRSRRRGDNGLRLSSRPRFGGGRLRHQPYQCDQGHQGGGRGVTDDAIHDAAFLGNLRRLAATARYVTSVCTGSLALGAAGLLRGKRAACHWLWRDLLAEFGAVPASGRVVRDGNIMTGGGVTAGIDFALTVTAELVGADAAQAIQLQIEYAPSPPFEAGDPETAPPDILALVRRRNEAIIGPRRAAVAAAAARLAAR